MLSVFILSSVGLGLSVFYLMYRQVYAGIVKSPSVLLRHILVLSVTYTLMFALGYALSVVIIPLLFFSGMIISSVLFFILALKMYSGIKKGRKHNWTFDTSVLKVLLLFAASNSFDAFFAGLAIGFFTGLQWFFFVIFSSIVILMILLANVMARRQSANLSVWIIGLLGAILLGANMIISVLFWVLAK